MGTILYPFCRWEDWGTLNISNLPTATQLVNGGARCESSQSDFVVPRDSKWGSRGRAKEQWKENSLHVLIEVWPESSGIHVSLGRGWGRQSEGASWRRLLLQQSPGIWAAVNKRKKRATVLSRGESPMKIELQHVCWRLCRREFGCPRKLVILDS